MFPSSNIRRIEVGPVSSEICPPSDTRSGLIFPPINAVPYSISFGVSLPFAEGILIPITGPPLQLEGEYWKCVLMRGVFAITAGGAGVGQVVELHNFKYDTYRPPIMVYPDPSLTDLPKVYGTINDLIRYTSIKSAPLKVGW